VEVVTASLGNVRFGSKADIARDQLNVHFTTKSRHSALRQKTSLFDHLVGAVEYL
jgi:hypothetical protein